MALSEILTRPLRRRFSDRDLKTGLRVWREWVRPHRRRLLVVFALMAATAAATGVYPLLIDQAYQMFAEPDGPRIWAVPLAIVAVTALKAAVFYAQTAASNVLVHRIVADVRIALFDHLQRADLASVQAVPAAEHVSRFLYGADVLKTLFTRTLTGLPRDLLTALALVAAMFWLDWAMALAVDRKSVV